MKLLKTVRVWKSIVNAPFGEFLGWRSQRETFDGQVPHILGLRDGILFETARLFRIGELMVAGERTCSGMRSSQPVA